MGRILKNLIWKSSLQHLKHLARRILKLSLLFDIFIHLLANLIGVSTLQKTNSLEGTLPNSQYFKENPKEISFHVKVLLFYFLSALPLFIPWYQLRFPIQTKSTKFRQNRLQKFVFFAQKI